MISNSNIIFSAVFSFAVSLTAIPLLIMYSAKKKKAVDVADGDALKIHKNPVSLLGGVGMALGVMAGFLWLAFIANSPEYLWIYLAMAVVFMLGFWDDLKWKHISQIRPFLKFFLLIICTFIPAVILLFAGISFRFFPVSAISIILGFAYIFIVINAVNYQDGMDGLAGGLAVISLIGFTALSLLNGNTFALAVSLVSLPAVIAFLLFNFPPAKIFMGDSGAYSLGLILASLAMIFSDRYSITSIVGPILVIGLPVIDGVFTNIRRLVKGKSIFLGDRSHFYDRLMQKGFSAKQTLAICCGPQIVLVIAGILIYR